MPKRAIEQGILVFPAGAATDVQVAGRTLLQRGIRTMASAGIKRVLVVLPPGHAPSGKSLVLRPRHPSRANHSGSRSPTQRALPAAQGRLRPPPLLAASPHRRGPATRRPRRADQRRRSRQQRSIPLRVRRVVPGCANRRPLEFARSASAPPRRRRAAPVATRDRQAQRARR